MRWKWFIGGGILLVILIIIIGVNSNKHSIDENATRINDTGLNSTYLNGSSQQGNQNGNSTSQLNLTQISTNSSTNSSSGNGGSGSSSGGSSSGGTGTSPGGDGNGGDSEIPNPSIQSKRSYELGVVPIPVQPITTQGWIDAFDLIHENAEYVLHHTSPDWIDFVNSTDVVKRGDMQLEGVNFVALMAKNSGIKTLIVVDPLRSDREEIDTKLPVSIGTNFGNISVREAYKNYAVRVARDYKPNYMGLGSEVNTYMLKHPEDVDNWVSLYKETYALVKTESPETIITTTLQYESLNGKVDGEAHWDIIGKFEPKLDVVAITTYPSPWFTTPAAIPDTYYSQLKDHTVKPIIIAESGWPSAGEAAFHGSEENQKQFLVRVDALTKTLNVKLWIWWFFHDWDGEGYADFFKSMGLIKSDGTTKSAWNEWQSLHNQTLE